MIIDFISFDLNQEFGALNSINQKTYHLTENRNFYLFHEKPIFFQIKRLSHLLNASPHSSKIPSAFEVNQFLANR